MTISKIPKTNAARRLETMNIPFELHTADVDESDLSAVTLAHRLGADPASVFKTLVARGDKTGVLMACIPAAAELDLKALAHASGNKHVEMVPLKEVRPLTGYVRGGCSPLAAKKAYPVFVDESAILQEKIFVSAGQRGVQLKLQPDDLLRAAGGVYAMLTRA
ncbi:MAG: Cys-tRNA(Pro) deacylase [Desulfovibrio sp.]|nr:Cys-tRNA(Pro) deacylase [Desulfovibrio sp.]